MAGQLDQLLQQLGQQGEAGADIAGAEKFASKVTRPIVGAGAGLVAGALENPFIGSVVQAGRDLNKPLLRQQPRGLSSLVTGGGPTPEALAEAPEERSVADTVQFLKSEHGRKPGFKTFEFLGEYGPDVYGAAKIVGGARLLAETAMETAAPRIVARLDPGRVGTLAKQARELAAFAADEVGSLLPTKAPVIYRVGQGLANTVGSGAFMGARSAAAGDDVGTIGSQALQGLMWGALAEGGFAVLGPVVSKYATRVNLSEAVDNYVWSKAPQATKDVRESLRTSFGKAVNKLAESRVALEAERQVLTLAKDIEEQVSSRVARTGASAVLEAEAGVAKAFGVVKEASTKANQAEHAFKAFNREFISGQANLSALNRSKPLAEGSFGMDARLALLRSPFPLLAITPQAFAGKLGITGVRAYTALGRSESEFQTVWAAKHEEALGFWKEARDIMGQPSARNGQFFRPVGHAWEQGGAEQVLREFPEQGPQLVDLLGRIKKWRSDLRAPAVKMGAEPNLTEAELAALGVKEHWAHVVRDLSDHETHSLMVSGLKKRLAREHPDWKPDRLEVTAREIATRSNRYPNDKLASVGSLDKTRIAPGTLSEKADDGMPFIEDYFESLVADARAVTRRTAYAKRWGWDGELADEAVKLVAAEGGSESLMRAVFDGFFKVDPGRAGWRRAAQVFTNAQVAAKMTFAVLPNMGQSSNTLGALGIRNTWNGLTRMLRGENIQRLDHQVGSLDGVFQALRATEMGGYTGHDWLQKLVDFEMKLTLFTPSEHINRMIGGAAAGEMIRDTLAKASLGKLRGNNLDFARRQFSKLDANLDDMVRRLRAGGSLDPLEVDSMVYRGAQLTQFMPDLTRRPFGWNTPLGRVLSQFNNFVVGQTNFLRHEVIAEVSRGNYKPLATLAVAYPTVGEFVGNALELTGREKPKRGLGLWLDRLALSGGLGVVYQLYTAARWGRSAEMALGPTVGGTALPLGEAGIQSAIQEDLEPMARMARNLPIVRGGLLFRDAGAWTLDNFSRFEELLGESGDSSQAPTLDELRMRKVIGK